MRIYNTLTRRKEEFIPIKEGQVGFYVCGPTVYDDIHIGNARTFISFDVIRRYLEYSGYQVTFVQNVTDVDDKIINRAAEEGISAAEVALKYTDAFVEVMQAIGVREPTVRPRATEEIATMIGIIERLIESGHAYVVDNDVYFAVRSYSEYGYLSRRNVDHLISGFRVDVDDRKTDALDFALWKSAKPGEPAWDSPWGSGRPGWHIECSAMSSRYLGESFDIHGGGEDLIFPHHENEIAQSRSVGGEFAHVWMHTGMLTINGEKMSKSEGNFLTLKDILRDIRPQALRLLMLQSHYRSPFDYSVERPEEAQASLLRIENSLRNLDWAARNATDGASASDQSLVEALRANNELALKRFTEQMDDDFNSAGAIAAIFELISQTNTLIAQGVTGADTAKAAGETADLIRKLLSVLGVDLTAESDAAASLPAAVVDLAAELVGYQGSDSAEAVELLLDLRTQARASKDWAVADSVRDGLTAIGLTIEDTASGTRVF